MKPRIGFIVFLLYVVIVMAMCLLSLFVISVYYHSLSLNFLA